MTDLAQLKTALADRYDIDREIGAGGMATVYLARDPRHDRNVAVKVLNPELGAVLGVERFLSEIKVTANLQHPNLLPLFDSGEAAGLLFYVMPFVEGESLRAKLDREKQFPVDEAIRIAVAVGNALDYAHGHGVIHRDLKPENILLQAGQPVVADFGIALAVSKAGGQRITQTGLSLGTPQYMSPEQATGDRVIDARSDIYSLAAMTYEMLTGEPPHIGNTAQAIIARVLTDKPRPIRASRSAVPEHVEATLERALEKLPADRFGTAHEFVEALQGRAGAGVTRATAASMAAARAAKRSWRERLTDPLVVAAGIVAIGALATAFLTRNPSVSSPLKTIRFIVATPDSSPATASFPWPATISPDGSAIVYLSRGEQPNQQELWLLRTNQVTGHVIPGTVGAHQPHFSPDGEWLGFEQGSKQWKVRLDGSTPVAITDGASSNGIDWTTHDEIVVGATNALHGISHVSAAGGQLAELTHPDSAKGELDHLWPIAHPDGMTIAFTIWSGAQPTAQIAVTTLGSGKVTALGLKGVRPLAFLDDYLVYLQSDGAVMAVAMSGTNVKGRPIPVHDRVNVNAGANGNSGIFISSGGAMIVDGGELRSRIAWMARDGTTRPVSKAPGSYSNPTISPDGSRVAMLVNTDGKVDVWTLDLGTSTLSRLTTVGTVTWASWTADSRSLVYSAGGANSRSGFWRQGATGGAPAELLYESTELAPAGAIAPDGKSLVVMVLHESTWDLVRVSLDGAKDAKSYVASESQEMLPGYSPDGKWIAYQSDESGTTEVYVRSFPDPTTKVQVSAGGGFAPRWSGDGATLFYSSGNGATTEAKVVTTPAFRVVSRNPAFPAGFVAAGGFTIDIATSRDGKQQLGLLTDTRDYRLTASPNWINEFRERVKPTTKK